MRKIEIFGIAALAAMMFAGCEDKTAVDDTPAVTVSGRTLTRGQLEADVAALLANKEIPAEQLEYATALNRSRLVQSFIVESSLLAMADEAGLDASEEEIVAYGNELVESLAGNPDAPKTFEELLERFPLGKERAREELANEVRITKLRKAALEENPVVVDAEAKRLISRIEADNSKIAPNEEEALKRVTTMKADLDATPADQLTTRFAQLAQMASCCPSSRNGGDLGTFGHGDMVQEFDECAFALPVGTVSGPVKTRFGYHLIMTTERNEAVAATENSPAVPETVRASHILVKFGEPREVPEMAEVVDYLKTMREREVMQDLLLKAIASAKIEAADDFKQYLPPAEAETAAGPEEDAQESAE